VRSLLVAAHPQIEARSLLPENPPADVATRLDLVMRAFTRLTLEWEPQLRTSLRLSLEPGAEQPVLRGGRAIGWIKDALAPLRETHPDIDLDRLAVQIRSATGIEALIWLIDIGGQPRDEAVRTLHRSARALLRAALAEAEAGPRPAASPPSSGVE
jgi:hypothetical protein